MTIQQIPNLRKKKGITQKQLARLLRKHQTFISKLENGKRKLTPELKKKMTQIFGGAR